MLSPMLEAKATAEPPGECCPDVIGAIGNTPIVELKRLSPKQGVRLFAKLEFYNPTGLGQGPRREVDDRARGGRGRDRARPAHPRADVRQHRHLARR